VKLTLLHCGGVDWSTADSRTSMLLVIASNTLFWHRARPSTIMATNVRIKRLQHGEKTGSDHDVRCLPDLTASRAIVEHPVHDTMSWTAAASTAAVQSSHPTASSDCVAYVLAIWRQRRPHLSRSPLVLATRAIPAQTARGQECVKNEVES
jgi:hypothetical protein